MNENDRILQASQATCFRRIFHSALSLAALAALAGCGTTAPKPVVGQILFTDAKGNALTAPTALAVGGSIYLEVAVANDSLLGADWTASCSSAIDPGNLPPGTLDTSCGTFTPAHTLSGPVPSYVQTAAGYALYVTQYTAPTQVPKGGNVTLTAYATALPTRRSTVTLTLH